MSNMAEDPKNNLWKVDEAMLMLTRLMELDGRNWKGLHNNPLKPCISPASDQEATYSSCELFHFMNVKL